MVQLGGRGLVAGRGATARGGDENASERQPVVRRHGVRPVAQALAVELPVEPLPRLVAREHAAGPVRSVRPRGEPYDHEPRAWISEPGDGLSPVDFIAIGGPADARHLEAVRAKARAALAG